MRSFFISVFILAVVVTCLISTSLYSIVTVKSLSENLPVPQDIDFSSHEDISKASETIRSIIAFLEERTKIMSLYIHRSKCADLVLMLHEMRGMLINGEPELYQVSFTRLSEALQDIAQVEGVTIEGIA